MTWLESMKNPGEMITSRPRRNRQSESIRDLVKETRITPKDFVYPLFVQEGDSQKTPITSMPNCFRLSPDLILKEIKEIDSLEIPAIALFPVVADALKDEYASEAKNEAGLIPTMVRKIKDSFPHITVITDVAMDPYSSTGHDGIIENGKILNDATLEILAEMALLQARSGADLIAPSDMMDGRVHYIRNALDQNHFTDVGIISYAAKYASAFYGPFRNALNSAPKLGDKKTYQMDPANSREAIREVALDIREGADIILIKPALAYLDIINQIKNKFHVPIAAYQVSGEYAMIHAAAEKGWLERDAVMLESLTAIKRSGADIIFSYFAKQAVSCL